MLHVRKLCDADLTSGSLCHLIGLCSLFEALLRFLRYGTTGVPPCPASTLLCQLKVMCLRQVLLLPANKMKISRDGVGVVKDHFSLAFYNVSPDVTLTLGTRERGGGRKK